MGRESVTVLSVACTSRAWSGRLASAFLVRHGNGSASNERSDSREVRGHEVCETGRFTVAPNIGELDPKAKFRTEGTVNGKTTPHLQILLPQMQSRTDGELQVLQGHLYLRHSQAAGREVGELEGACWRADVPTNRRARQGYAGGERARGVYSASLRGSTGAATDSTDFLLDPARILRDWAT